MNTPTKAATNRALWKLKGQLAECRARHERKQNMKNIGHLNGNWKNGERPSLDDAPFELTPLELLQIKLNVAHQFLYQGTPAMIEFGQRRIAEVVAEVMSMVMSADTQNGVTK